MSTWKIATDGPEKKRDYQPGAADQIEEAAPALAQKIEITSLELDQDHAEDCDPYNSTGQYCVIDFER